MADLLGTAVLNSTANRSHGPELTSAVSRALNQCSAMERFPALAAALMIVLSTSQGKAFTRRYLRILTGLPKGFSKPRVHLSRDCRVFKKVAVPQRA